QPDPVTLAVPLAPPRLAAVEKTQAARSATRCREHAGRPAARCQLASRPAREGATLAGQPPAPPRVIPDRRPPADRHRRRLQRLAQYPRRADLRTAQLSPGDLPAEEVPVVPVVFDADVAGQAVLPRQRHGQGGEGRPLAAGPAGLRSPAAGGGPAARPAPQADAPRPPRGSQPNPEQARSPLSGGADIPVCPTRFEPVPALSRHNTRPGQEHL